MILFAPNKGDLYPLNMYNFNVTTKEATLVETYAGPDILLGAPFAYNPVDNFIYVVRREPSPGEQITKIGSDFEVQDLGWPDNMPVSNNYSSGTFDDAGFFYVADFTQNRYYTIDMRDGSPTFMKLVDPTAGYVEQIANFGTEFIPPDPIATGAWAFHDGLIYGITQMYGNILTIDPTTGQVTQIPTNVTMQYDGILAMGIDSNGVIYVMTEALGQFIKYTITNGVATGLNYGQQNFGQGYVLGGVMCPYANPMASITNIASTDVIGCDGEVIDVPSNPVDVGIVDLSIVKSADCSWAIKGGKIKYCVAISNASDIDLPGSVFRDVLDLGLRYVDGSFTVDGVPQTPTVSGNTIEYDLDIPANTTILICFQVLVL